MSQPDDQDPLLYERDGDVAILSFNIPKRLNPLTQPLQEALRPVSYTHLTLPTILLV